MAFFFRNKKTIPPNATFRLTQEGKEKVQEFNGDPKHQVLMALETKGTSDVAEISAASGLSRGSVERLIPVLSRGGYIQYIHAAQGGDLE